MKSLYLLFFSLCFISTAFARPFQEAIIYSIDDYDYEKNYVEVSEEALPRDMLNELLRLIDTFKFTTMTEHNVKALFDILKLDRNARNRMAGGACSTRRAYIQNYLKKMNVVSGRLYISCPAINGRMRLKDQATNHYYSFANYHDTNILSVSTSAGKALWVLDVQFENTPVSLQDYLAEIEVNQKIRPLKRKGDSRGLCYWTISSPSLSYKNADQ